MKTKTKSIDITKNTQRVAEFMRELGRFSRPIDILLDGQIVGRLVPPAELSEQEKASAGRRGWELVQRARKRNEGIPEEIIGKAVDTAVKRVRGR